MIPSIPCEFCGQPPSRALFEVDGYRIVECRSCGVVYVANPPGIGELKEEYDAFHGGRVPNDKPVYIDRRASKIKGARRRMKWLEQWIAPPGRFLDVGCAAGFCLDVARKRGWEVHGVEISEVAARYAREEFGLENVRCAPIESVEYPAGHFDLITIWACIEHMTHPAAALEKAVGWLRPGGILGINTCNRYSLGPRVKGRRWRLMTPPSHLFFFSRAFFERRLPALGLDIVGYGTGNFVFEGWPWRTKKIRRMVERLQLGDVMSFAVRKKPVEDGGE
ncbi:class I SAM-dependent methyltransferase [Candidatus Sumerlaeota bacterium]|nr:class I SAM-dependent methyltransferase [Candidatus Sumerlaeota bacterium]